MTARRKLAAGVVAMAAAIETLTLAPCAGAADPVEAPKMGGSVATPADPVKEAELHFRRGVELYKDNDSGGALVEFKRAYELAPNFRVLYNLGQTYFQLQRYADALKTLQAFLGEGGSQIAADKRAAVEADVRQLQNRVGQVEVKVDLEGAQILVDDDPVGTAPLAQPVAVSVGHRRIAAMKAGAPTQQRFVDVTAGDTVTVTLEFLPSTPTPALVPAPASSRAVAPAAAPAPAPGPEHGRAGAWIAWGITGLFGAATAVTGVLALAAKSDLSKQLDVFPGDAGAIDRDRSQTKTFGILSDALLGATVVAGAVAVYVTLSGHSHAPATEVGIGPTGIELRGTY